MGTLHTVVQGEHLSHIARNYGFTSFKPIWHAGENAALRDKRKTPDVLFPGDQVFIPDKGIREEPRPTDQKHRFVRQGETLMLRVVLKGFRDEPLKRHEGTLQVESDGKVFNSKDDGLLEREIPATAEHGLILDTGEAGILADAQRELQLKIGHLDPVDELSGQMARLNNLGYGAGPVPARPLSAKEEADIRTSMTFRSAVEEFQCDAGLLVDGKCGKQTQAKLVAVHGC